MSPFLIIILIVIVALAVAGAIIFFVLPSGGGFSTTAHYEIPQEQLFTTRGPTQTKGKPDNIFETGATNTAVRSDSRLTLKKKLKYAGWKITPATFRALTVCVSLISLAIFSVSFHWSVQILSLSFGPIFTSALLNFSVERRFKAFDCDYPAFLLSVVGLLKTGMNVMGALEAAAQGMSEGSCIREEVEMMIDRLRFGVPEEKSIGAFAEDVYHPEIELFVQALLLSRRVGGTLSDTLERLSKQVRKRQFFRASAVAAVGMQRGSIWFIIGILTGLECYLYVMYPEAVVGAWADPVGWGVWQFGLSVIFLGMFWVRQVTKLKV